MIRGRNKERKGKQFKLLEFKNSIRSVIIKDTRILATQCFSQQAYIGATAAFFEDNTRGAEHTKRFISVGTEKFANTNTKSSCSLDVAASSKRPKIDRDS